MRPIRGVLSIALIASVSGGTLLGQASIPGAVLANAEPHHHRTYEDSTIRVLRVRVPAHDSTLLHEHDPDYFWIALGASDVVNARPGVPDAIIHSSDLSIHYTPGHFAHVARNPGDAPFDNITVELLRRQTNVRNQCDAAVAGQPLDCVDSHRPAEGVPGVDEHPAFATDQMQLSLVQLAPGATFLPDAAHTMWLIALDTADTRGNRPRLAVRGGGRWSGGVFRNSKRSWSVSNTGARPLRFLALRRR